MKFLAMEKEIQGVTSDRCRPYLRAEAERVLELYESGTLREIYFRGDRDAAVLVLECSSVDEVGRVLSTLPLVREGLIRFDVIPLVPYPGFRRIQADL